MPELPEVETVRTGLAPMMEGNQIIRVQLNRANLRFVFPDKFAARLTGARVQKLSRRAKYLLFGLDTSETLLCHLGMSGSFLALAPNQAIDAKRNTKHDHVVFEMKDGSTLIYNDPRRFGFMDLFASDSLAQSKFLHGLGQEPTGNEMSAKLIADKLAQKKAPIKSALLDQRLIAGLGNIYVCEILFRSHIHPAAKSSNLGFIQIEDIVSHTREVIREAIEAGGSSLNDFTNPDGDLGYFQHNFDVYGRAGETCRTEKCTAKIERMVQSGRSSFYCPACQTM